jgi:hypothetical protein
LGLGAAAALPAQAAAGEVLLAWWHSCPPSDLSTCVATRESQVLAEQADTVRRVDGQLLMQQDTTPRRWAQVASDASTRYLGELDNSPFSLLLVQAAGQAPQFKLVSRQGALPIALDAPPVLSPDGLRMVVVASPQAGRTGSLTLWQRLGTHSAQKFRLETDTALGYSFEGWRQDGAAVRLRWQRLGASCAPETGRSQLRDGPFGWDVYPPAPTPCP